MTPIRCTNYWKAQTILGSRDTRNVCNNTRLIKDDQDIHVELHNTRIITYHPDESVTLRTGGWRTVTTKARISEYSDVNLCSESGSWMVRMRDAYYQFEDSMTVSPRNNTASTLPVIVSVLEKITGKEITSQSEIASIISDMDYKQISRLWRAGRYYLRESNRQVVAQYCQEKFLPLLLTSKPGRLDDEAAWKTIVEERLRKD